MIIYWKYLFIVGCCEGFYGCGCFYCCLLVCEDMCNFDNGKCLDDVSVMDCKCLKLIFYFWCWNCIMLFIFFLRVLVYLFENKWEFFSLLWKLCVGLIGV